VNDVDGPSLGSGDRWPTHLLRGISAVKSLDRKTVTISSSPSPKFLELLLIMHPQWCKSRRCHPQWGLLQISILCGAPVSSFCYLIESQAVPTTNRILQGLRAVLAAKYTCIGVLAILILARVYVALDIGGSFSRGMIARRSGTRRAEQCMLHLSGTTPEVLSEHREQSWSFQCLLLADTSFLAWVGTVLGLAMLSNSQMHISRGQQSPEKSFCWLAPNYSIQ